MIVAKMRTRHVPMKVLRFHVQCEHVRQQDIQRAGYVPDSIRTEVCRCFERGLSQSLGVTNVHLLSPADLRRLSCNLSLLSAVWLASRGSRAKAQRMR